MLVPYLYVSSYRAQTLHPKLRLNQAYNYKVSSVEKDFVGETSKVSKTLTQGMPIEITATKTQGAKTSVTVVTGPLIARGRSVGRSRTNDYDVDSTNSTGGDACALLGVVFPSSGVKPGQSWSSKLRAAPPFPAGLIAKYTFVKSNNQGGQKVALLSMKVASEGAIKVDGGGQLMVGAQDGILRSGKLHFELVYQRPGPDKKMYVNSHTTVDYTIGP